MHRNEEDNSLNSIENFKNAIAIFQVTLKTQIQNNEIKAKAERTLLGLWSNEKVRNNFINSRFLRLSEIREEIFDLICLAINEAPKSSPHAFVNVFLSEYLTSLKDDKLLGQVIGHLLKKMINLELVLNVKLSEKEFYELFNASILSQPTEHLYVTMAIKQLDIVLMEKQILMLNNYFQSQLTLSNNLHSQFYYEAQRIEEQHASMNFVNTPPAHR